MSSIVLFIVVIAIKHYHKQHELNFKNKIKISFNQILIAREAGKEINSLISLLNADMQKRPSDFICAFSALMREEPKNKRKNYLTVFFQLPYKSFLANALDSKNIKQQCLAIQIIGMCKIKMFEPNLTKLSGVPALSASACLAIAKIQGMASIDILSMAFQQQLISSSQLLTALVELPRKQLLIWHQQQLNAPVNSIISCYLENA